MAFPLIAIAGAYIISEAYKKFATPEQKRRWENFTRIHHGEAGILMAGAGLLTKSPNLTASGLGFILHDRCDSKKWFTGDKSRKKYSPVRGMA